MTKGNKHKGENKILTQNLTILTVYFLHFGPSGVRALPLAAGITVGGHYKWHFFLFFRLIANSPRRGCCRNSNFYMGS
jgi:hypothetical protein